MTITIALAGKGGTGKTTVSAMIIKYLIKKQNAPILAIDADPSANLNMVLGVDLDSTVGAIREDMLKQVQDSVTAGGAARGYKQYPEPGGEHTAYRGIGEPSTQETGRTSHEFVPCLFRAG